MVCLGFKKENNLPALFLVAVSALVSSVLSPVWLRAAVDAVSYPAWRPLWPLHLTRGGKTVLSVVWRLAGRLRAGLL